MKEKQGSIVSIVHGREFGFIRPSDDTGDVLFHFDGIDKKIKIDELTEGQEVIFELMPDATQENRIRAKNVRAG